LHLQKETRMLSKKMEAALNKQINQELFSAYQYMAIAAYFSEQNLKGFSNWMRVQAQEEITHSSKLFDYVVDRNGKIDLQVIKAPPKSWKDAVSAIQTAYKAEVTNTKQINTIMDLAIKENDHATRVILEWFVEEQVEEESSAYDLLEQIKIAHKSASAMFILDRELGARTPTSGQ
jgi:ferritin